ncbi:MAG: hypothetical protein JW776_03700 [Candidatus Lokiarchaeota archaeon]|nr:hypothetical protein [Candidatus Lokiarchaeota archaeon]
MTITITLSWFHRRIGPTIYYEYPESSLQPDELTRIPDLMDMRFEEGFFNHGFENLYLFNYFFEISSSWARGQKEMLLISVCFSNPISTQIQHEILVHCIDFANKLKKTKNLFKAFYEDGPPSGEFLVNVNDNEAIKSFDKDLKMWLRDLYWKIVSFSREKSEEEIIADLLSQKSVYAIIKFLSNGPVPKEDLEKWFSQKYPDLQLDDILTKLESEKFIFQNEIGYDTFVLLVKETTVQRSPPDCIITLIQDKLELSDLTTEFLDRVRNFFEEYTPSTEDSIELLKLVANPEIYNVLLQLRSGPLPKNQILSMIDSEPVKNLMETLKILNEKKIIDEFEYKGESLILLIDDIQFSTSFPSYLSKLTAKKPHPTIAKSFKTTRSTEKDPGKRELKGSELGILSEDVFNKLKNMSKQKGVKKEEENDG